MISGLLPVLLAAGVPVAAAAPAVEVLNVNGTGCRQHTTAVALSPDRTAFTITYSAYLTQFTTGSVTQSSVECTVNLKITAPSGYAPAVTSVDYRGFAEIAPGATGRQSASYRFHGAARVESAGRTFTGPFSGDWQVTDPADGGPSVGGCAGSAVLDLDSSLGLAAGSSVAGSASYLAMDSTDGVASSTCHLIWQRC